MSANNAQTNKEQPILTLIQDIKDGRVAPETIDKDLRQQCVEVFLAEGYSISTMAQIFQKSEKTLRRDLDEIRQRNALTPNVELAKKIIGEIVTYTRVHRDHLMRLARSKETGVSERAQSEYYAHRVGMELVEKLQTLGYLPLKPKTIVGDFTHNMQVSDEKSFDELRVQLLEIERVALEQGELSPELEVEVKKIRGRIEQAEIENSITKILDQQKKEVSNG
jgi:AraC-like DNA-binding protein